MSDALESRMENETVYPALGFMCSPMCRTAGGSGDDIQMHVIAGYPCLGTRRAGGGGARHTVPCHSGDLSGLRATRVHHYPDKHAIEPKHVLMSMQDPLGRLRYLNSASAVSCRDAVYLPY